MDTARTNPSLRSIIHDVQDEIPRRATSQMAEADYRFLSVLIDRLEYSLEDLRVRRVVKNYLLDVSSVKLLRQTEELAEPRSSRS